MIRVSMPVSILLVCTLGVLNGVEMAKNAMMAMQAAADCGANSS